MSGAPTSFNYERIKDLLRGVVARSDHRKSLERAALGLRVERLGEEEAEDERPLASERRSLLASRLGTLKREEAIASQGWIELATHALDLRATLSTS